MDEENQPRNAGSFWDDTIIGSWRASKLGAGKRLDAVLEFHKVMMRESSLPRPWK
jgi:hypothetical protein